LRKSTFDLFLEKEADDTNRNRADDDEPAHPGIMRETWAATVASLEQIEMIANERESDVPDIAREIDEHGEQGSKLHDGNRCCELLRCQRQIHDAARQDQMCR